MLFRSNLEEILNLCETNKEIDRKLCKIIWKYKIEQVEDKESVEKLREEEFDLKKLYILIYSLNKVKEAFKSKYNIYDLYMRDELDLSGRDIYKPELENKLIKKIPKEISVLSNLKKLDLSLNKISVIPKELGDLYNLKILFLYYNEITEIPKELGNLSNLEQLSLAYNKISEIPKEIGNLSKLQELNLSNNKDRKSTRLNSSHIQKSRMPSSA